MQKIIKAKLENSIKALLEYSALTYRIKERGVKRSVEDEIRLRLRHSLVNFEFIDDFGCVVKRNEADRLKLSRKFKKVGG